MATNSRNKGRAAQSLSGHPLFPAIVGLWFGALFGLGSLALRSSLIERAILAAHIDQIVPAAAPPLGATARILIALALGAVGCFMGILLARRLRRPGPFTRERTRVVVAAGPADAGMDQENEFDTTGDAGLNQMPPGRRRALAMVDEAAPAEDADPFLSESAPLPGTGPQILDVTAFDLSEPTIAAMPIPEAVEEAPELTATADELPLEFETSELVLEPVSQVAEPVSEAPPAEPAPLPPLRERLVLPQGTAAERIAGAELAELSPVELIERLALALQHRRQVGEAAAAAPSPAPLARFAPSVDEAAAEAADTRPAPVAASANLPAGAVAADEGEDDDAALCEAGYSSLLSISRAAPEPAGFVRIAQPGPDPDEIEPAVVFPGHDVRQVTRFAAPAAAEETPGAADQAAAAPASRRFDPTAGTSRDPAETEQALRTALATLQRMSGAA